MNRSHCWNKARGKEEIFLKKERQVVRFEIEQLQNLSFPDFNVIGVLFNPAEKYMQIEVDGAWFENLGSTGKELGNGTLIFKSWRNLEIWQYDSDLNTWVKMHFDAFECVKNICELIVGKNQICIQGFGKKSGKWLEYRIHSPQVQLEFEE